MEIMEANGAIERVFVLFSDESFSVSLPKGSRIPTRLSFAGQQVTMQFRIRPTGPEYFPSNSLAPGASEAVETDR